MLQHHQITFVRSKASKQQVSEVGYLNFIIWEMTEDFKPTEEATG